MGMAAVGAGAQVGGQIASGYGQHEALKDMRSAWDDQLAHQTGADAQLRALTDSLLQHVGVQQATNQAGQDALRDQLQTVARNTTAGAQKSLAKRGAKMGAEGRARTAQAYDAAGAQSQNLAQFLAAMQGMREGANQMDQSGRQFALNRGQVINNANQWRGLAPLQQQVAGQSGAFARRAGSQLQVIGQGVMANSMSRPYEGDDSSYYYPGPELNKP